MARTVNTGLQDAEQVNESPSSSYIYKDINLFFTKHPVSDDVTSVTDVQAVKRSVRNLVLTNQGERLFQPDIDSGIGILLFENFSALTTSRLESVIKQAVEKYEPRADLQNVTVRAKEEENAYQIIITYIPDNDVLETNLEVYLERT